MAIMGAPVCRCEKALLKFTDMLLILGSHRRIDRCDSALAIWQWVLVLHGKWLISLQVVTFIIRHAQLDLIWSVLD